MERENLYHTLHVPYLKLKKDIHKLIEALRIVFGVKKFHQHIFGHNLILAIYLLIVTL